VGTVACIVVADLEVDTVARIVVADLEVDTVARIEMADHFLKTVLGCCTSVVTDENGLKYDDLNKAKKKIRHSMLKMRFSSLYYIVHIRRQLRAFLPYVSFFS